MVQAQRVWNVWNWRALFQFFESICCLTHCLLNSTCVNWHQRYSIDKRPSLAVECTAALGARTSQSVEAGSGHCWFEPRNSKFKKLGRTGNKAPGYRKLQLSGVRGSSSLLCLLLWFHQQMSRTHFHNLQPIKSISCGGSHAWTCHSKRWLCWTRTLIPGRTEQTQWCIADICLGSPKTQVVVLIQSTACFPWCSCFLIPEDPQLPRNRVEDIWFQMRLTPIVPRQVWSADLFQVREVPNRAMDKNTRTVTFDAKEPWELSFLEIRTGKDLKELL